MSDNQKIVFVVPSKDSKGFARSIARVLELQEMKDSGSMNSAGWKNLVEFLADYVQAETRELAIELVWDASESQWDEMLGALGGASNVVPTQKSEPSESTSTAGT